MIVALVVLAVAVAAVYVLYNYSDRNPSIEQISPLAKSGMKGTFNPNKIIGTWVRPDGGYIISISKINSDGTLQAGYYNPNPINIGQAKISLKDDTAKLFLELRDEDAGYPGCTYDLSYDRRTDQLTGIYYQAVIKQNYNIVFLRNNLEI